jgi:hypothetical protein
MGTIFQKTAAAASGEANAGDLSCSRHQPARTGTLAGLAHRHPKAARWERTFPRDASTSRRLISSGGECAILDTNPGPITLDPPAVDPIPLFASKPQAHTLGYNPHTAGVSLAEKCMYGILAGGAVLAVSGGLGWTGDLVHHWAAFSAGIDKLLH